MEATCTTHWLEYTAYVTDGESTTIDFNDSAYARAIQVADRVRAVWRDVDYESNAAKVAICPL